MELISVIIPCYRQAHFLGEAIESVFAQTYPHYEIVVVDDGSPDNTAEVARRFPGVRYVRQTNKGLSAARNTGIRESRGDYLVFLDADDHLLPNHFEVSLNAFRRRPDAAFVCGDYRWFNREESWHIHKCDPLPDYYGTLLRFNFIGPPLVVTFTRRCLLSVGGFDETLKSCEDQDIYLRITRTSRICCHHEIVGEYRGHADQMSRNWETMLKEALKVLRAQRKYIKGDRQYEECYRIGLAFRKELYCDPLLWKAIADMRTGAWGRALKYFFVLLRFYPSGFVNMVEQKLSRILLVGR